MKIKTKDLTGAALDWTVAKCEGWVDDCNGWLYQATLAEVADGRYRPSTEWAQGGPIIEREKINIDGRVGRAPGAETFGPYFRAWQGPYYDDPDGAEYGPTPLIAAMRCFVASKLGDTVDVPSN